MPRTFAPPRMALPVAQVSGMTSAVSMGVAAMVMRIVTASPLQLVPFYIAVATLVVVQAALRIDPYSVNPTMTPAVWGTVAVVLWQTAAAVTNTVPGDLLDIDVQGKAAVCIEVAHALSVSASTNEASKALGEVHQMTHLWRNSDKTPLLHLCVHSNAQLA